MTTFQFHHTGVACASIDDQLGLFGALGYAPESAPFIDGLQGIRGVFLVGPGTRVELVEQLPGWSVLDSWLRLNVRLYHQGFLTDDLEGAMGRLRENGAVVVKPPTPAVAFGGRRIAFMMLPGMLLVELVEGVGER